MKKEIKTRVTAGVLSAVMLCAAVPVTTAFSSSSAGIVSAAEDDGTTEIYSSGFEDGDVSAFTGRGGVETITATDSQAYSGKIAGIAVGVLAAVGVVTAAVVVAIKKKRGQKANKN